MKKILFLIFLLATIVSYFAKNNYRAVTDIDPALLNDPIQTGVKNKDIIKFTKDDYQYELTPLYDYELNGFIVHKMDYTLFSIYKLDSVFPMDLCAIWGDNLKNNIYQDKTLKFSQDSRFCFYRWQGNLKVNTSQISNNHLVIENEDLDKKIKALSNGDQVKIKGKLVNVHAKNTGGPGKYDPKEFDWNSSTTRSDSGVGACETIFVRDIEILNKANPIYHNLFTIGLWGLVIMSAWGLISIFWPENWIPFK